MQSRQIYTLLPGNVYRNELILQIHVNFFPSKISLRFSYDFSEKEVPVNLRFQSISAKITDQKTIGNLLIYYSVSRRITSLNFSDGLPVIYSNVVFIYHFWTDMVSTISSRSSYILLNEVFSRSFAIYTLVFSNLKLGKIRKYQSVHPMGAESKTLHKMKCDANKL